MPNWRIKAIRKRKILAGFEIAGIIGCLSAAIYFLPRVPIVSVQQILLACVLGGLLYINWLGIQGLRGGL